MRIRAVDLEPDNGIHERGTELRAGRGPKHDRPLEHRVVDRQDHGKRADADGDPPEALVVEQAEAFLSREVAKRLFGMSPVASTVWDARARGEGPDCAPDWVTACRAVRSAGSRRREGRRSCVRKLSRHG